MTALVGETVTIDPEEISTTAPLVFADLPWLGWGRTQRVPASIIDSQPATILSGNVSAELALLRRTALESSLRLKGYEPMKQWLREQRQLAGERLVRLQYAMRATEGLSTTSTFSGSPLTHNVSPLNVVQIPNLAIMTPTSDYPVLSLAFDQTSSGQPAVAQCEVTPGMVYQDYIAWHLARLAAQGFGLMSARAHVGPYAHPDARRESGARYPSAMRNIGFSIACQLAESGIDMVAVDDNTVRDDKTRFSDRTPRVFGRTATAICVRDLA